MHQTGNQTDDAHFMSNCFSRRFKVKRRRFAGWQLLDGTAPWAPRFVRGRIPRWYARPCSRAGGTLRGCRIGTLRGCRGPCRRRACSCCGPSGRAATGGSSPGVGVTTGAPSPRGGIDSSRCVPAGSRIREVGTTGCGSG